MTVLLVAPSAREALTPGLSPNAGTGVSALICGSGARAGAKVDDFLRAHPVDALLTVGVCGGLDPSLRPGDLILARRVIALDGTAFAPDAALLAAARRALGAAGCRFVSSTLLTWERPAGTVAQKTDLWNAWGAAGVDMETGEIVAATEAHQVRWLALRAVVDGAGSDLPPPLRRWWPEADERTILHHLLYRPEDWAALARLALGMARAKRALAQGAPSLVEALRSFVGDALPVNPSRRAAHE